MKPSTITIIALIIMSILVVGLMVFAYVQIIKSTAVMSKSGLLDEECIKDQENKKEHKLSRILLNTLSISLTSLVLLFCGLGVYYKLSGNHFSINNQTAFVIATNSMEDYVSDDYKSILVSNIQQYQNCSEEEANQYISKSQFNAGDILMFDDVHEDESLELYHIYGYRNSKGQIVVHRLISIEDGKYIFRGDNAPGNDSIVRRNQIIYSYHNNHIVYIGYFVLFASSGFGIYSLIIVSGIFIMSDIAKHQYNKIKKDRIKYLELEGGQYAN